MNILEDGPCVHTSENIFSHVEKQHILSIFQYASKNNDKWTDKKRTTRATSDHLKIPFFARIKSEYDTEEGRTAHTAGSESDTGERIRKLKEKLKKQQEMVEQLKKSMQSEKSNVETV